LREAEAGHTDSVEISVEEKEKRRKGEKAKRKNGGGKQMRS
jgi:hypothetical protein